MRVIAFSCAHLMGDAAKSMLLEEGEELDYTPIRTLISRILQNPPDFVVNLGDFVEPVYDENTQAVIEELVPEYNQLGPTYEINGNHDSGLYPQSYTVIDGVRYEHGDRLVPSEMSKTEEYIAYIRKSAREWGPKLVHGHSHYPNEGWPLDVGSITFSKTYGEIIDGEKARIKWI